MNVTNISRDGRELPVTVYKVNAASGKTIYNIQLYKKIDEEQYENGYIQAVFNKDVEIPNKTKINLKQAKLDFYKKDKVTNVYIRVFEYELVETKKDDEGYVTISDDDELPF